MAGSFLPLRPMCRGTRLGAALIFDWVFFGGAGRVLVAVFLAAPPEAAGFPPRLCFPPRVALAAISVSSSWEADPKRTCSVVSVSAASVNRD